MTNMMTRSTYERLYDEMNQIQKEEIPKVSKAKLAAAEEGDLKENAEYQACKEKLVFLQNRYADLQARTAAVRFIDDLKIPGNIVSIGTSIEVLDLGDEKKVKYTILGSEDSDLEKNIISISSPVGRAMIGKKVNQEVLVDVPDGEKSFKILDIKPYSKV